MSKLTVDKGEERRRGDADGDKASRRRLLVLDRGVGQSIKQRLDRQAMGDDRMR
jgi:hypothetical protein